MKPRNPYTDVRRCWKVEYRCEYRPIEPDQETDYIIHCKGSIDVFAKTIDRAIEMARMQLTNFFGDFEILGASASGY